MRVLCLPWLGGFLEVRGKLAVCECWCYWGAPAANLLLSMLQNTQHKVLCAELSALEITLWGGEGPTQAEMLFGDWKEEPGPGFVTEYWERSQGHWGMSGNCVFNCSAGGDLNAESWMVLIQEDEKLFCWNSAKVPKSSRGEQESEFSISSVNFVALKKVREEGIRGRRGGEWPPQQGRAD